MSSLSDATAPFSTLLESFDPATSAADDILVLAAIVASVLVALVSRRVARRRRVEAIDRHVHALIEVILDLLAPHGATGIHASWTSRDDRLDLVVDFGRRPYFLAGFLQLPAEDAASGLLQAYLSSDADTEPAEAPEPDEARDTAGGPWADEPDREEEAAPAEEAQRRWWEILGVGQDASAQEIRTAHRTLVLANHPDRGGDQDTMARINAARDEALRSTV
jgi:DnaJ-class molecular chaperone with C-terminal Zn finger domain